MSSKLRHITRRRKNALKNLAATNSEYALKQNKHSIVPPKPPEFLQRNARIRKEEAEILNYRINGGNHSSAWFKKQNRRKQVAPETEAA